MKEHLDIDATLARLGGDKELLKELFTAFVEDLPGRVEELTAAMQAGDLQAAERRAHSIKGACAAVGAVPARDVASELEQVCLTGDADRAGELAAQLVEDIKDCTAAMNAFQDA